MDLSSLKRQRKPSKAFLRSQGLASDDDYNNASSTDSPDSEPGETPATVSSSTAATPSIASSRQPSPALSLSSQPSVSQVSSSRPASALSFSVSATPVSSAFFRSGPATGNAKEQFERRFKCATTSNEDVLAAQTKGWKSAVYAHFTMPPEISEDDHGNVTYFYRCLTRPSSGVHRARHDDSTSNLLRHVKQCAPANTQEAHALRVYAQGSQYSEAKHRMKIALWIARRNRPFAIVEDEELLDIFHDLNSACITPKRRTVARDVSEIFVLSRKNVSALLQAYPGKLHICADGWSSPNVIAFIGATVHWIIDGQMVSVILDFIKATKAHTGVYLAARIAECLREYGIEDQILGFTADNASNNDTLIQELSNLLPNFKGPASRVRCFAHILNLVVKAILSPFGRSKAGLNLEDPELERELAVLEDDLSSQEGMVGDEDPVVEDDDELAPDIVMSDAAAVEDIVSEVELSLRLTPLSAQDSKLGQVSITKLRALANKISNSPTLRADLEGVCQSTSTPAKLMIRDVPTRWNSTAELVQRALELKAPLNVLVIKAEHNRPRGVRLGRFRLLESEWDIMKQLSPLLELFLYATKKISDSKTPLIHQVVPIIDSLTTALDGYINNSSLHPVVRHAALRGLLMLNKYYARTDESIVYRIAMVLHPRYKTAYFSRVGWPREWIDEAVRLTREEWTKRYKPKPSSSASTLDKSKDTADRFSDARKYFEELDNNPSEGPIDALEEWLANPVIMTSADPIVYWTAQGSAGNSLARMALDFLSIPASSTDVERAFSRGGHTVSRFRHSLSDESVRASSVLGSWTTLNGAIQRDQIITLFKNKKSRKGAKRQKPNPDDVIELDD